MGLKMWEVRANELKVLIRQEASHMFLKLTVTTTLTDDSLFLAAATRGMRAPNGATFRNKEQRPQCRQGRSRKLKRRTWAACWSASRLQRAGGEGGGRAAVRVRSSTVGVKGPAKNNKKDMLT